MFIVPADLDNLEHLLGPEVVALGVAVDRSDRCVCAEDAMRVCKTERGRCE